MSKLNKQQLNNKQHKTRKPINIRKVLIVLTMLAYIVVQVIIAIQDAKVTEGTMSLTELYKCLEDGEIKSVSITKSSNLMYVEKTDGTLLNAVNPQNDTFIFDLMEKGIDVKVQDKSVKDSMFKIILTLPMTLIMMMVILYLLNTIVGGNVKMFNILKTKDNHTTFEDIKGLGKTKTEVKFIIEQLKNWKSLGEIGARPCKGVLLYGPPGTGKTMLAKAIAKEAGVAFISASGSDFNEVFVGVGAGRVRALWELASFNSPCIIFIDEIDCLGKRRKGGDGASNDHNQTLNALLQKMDGLNKTNGIMVIGATNRLEDLDPALIRPGRFDRHYYVGAPDNKKDRDELVELYISNKKLDSGVNVNTASKLLTGLSGAEIEQSLNEAVYISLQDSRNGVIQIRDIDEAVMKLHTGGVKKEHSSDRDMRITAIHEAGHTLVSLLLGVEIAKVSIIPYSSGTGGVTVRDIDKTGDIKLKLIDEYMNDIKVLLAGKVAEDIVLNEHTQGCTNDIEKATELVYNIVTRFAYDDKSLVNNNILAECSNSILDKAEITDKCNKILYDCNKYVYNLIEEHITELSKLSVLLMEKQTIVNPTLELINKHDINKRQA